MSRQNVNLCIVIIQFHCKNRVLGKVLRRVYIYTQCHIYKQDVFKYYVFLQDKNSQVIFLCRTLWFCKTHLLKPFLRHVLPEDVSLCLRFVFSSSTFFLFLLPRHVLCMTLRHHFYIVFQNFCVFSVLLRTILVDFAHFCRLVYYLYTIHELLQNYKTMIHDSQKFNVLPENELISIYSGHSMTISVI